MSVDCNQDIVGTDDMAEDMHNDQFLLTRAAAGDGAALAVLLLDREQPLLNYVRRRLPLAVQSLVDADDIVQETSYEACRMIHGFVPQGPDSFHRWLLRIANFRIKAAIQKFRSRKTVVVSVGLDDEGSITGALAQLATYRRTPSASASIHEFAAVVEQSLQSLIPDYREVILHRFINGLSVEETATRMQRDSDKIYVLCSRAIRALRMQLASASHFI